jgi:hypothetical protein
MTKSTVTVTPKDDSPFIELSNGTGKGLFRKRILPKGSIKYAGRTVTFNDTLLSNIVDGFKKGAYDQSSFCFANEQNDHKVKPQDWGGDVKGLEVAEDGLYATMELATHAADLVRANPKLGVSPAIRINYTREADGATFPAALHHVLGTLDPKVTNLGEWEELSLANADEVITDLSNEQWLAPPVQAAQPTQQEIDDALLAIRLANEITLEGGDTVTIPTQQDNRDLELSNTRIANLELELANTRFETLQAELVDAGVPPVMITLAEPLLRLPHVEEINLSNGAGTVDPVGVVKALLDECKGFIKLANEQGNTFDGKSQEASYVDQQLQDWKVG